MRDAFVGTLVATGVCLIAYRMTDKGDWRNGVSTFAGLMAILVAFFPTSIPTELEEAVKGVDPTPLQEYWGESEVSVVHGTSAFLLIGALCVMSIMFWRREKLRTEDIPRSDGSRKLHKLGSAVHLGCVLLMLASCAWIGLNFALKKAGSQPWNEDFLLYGEWGAIWGFAVSFVVQGYIHRRATNDTGVKNDAGDENLQRA
jgi:hypothetical protein